MVGLFGLTALDILLLFLYGLSHWLEDVERRLEGEDDTLASSAAWWPSIDHPSLGSSLTSPCDPPAPTSRGREFRVSPEEGEMAILTSTLGRILAFDLGDGEPGVPQVVQGRRAEELLEIEGDRDDGSPLDDPAGRST